MSRFEADQRLRALLRLPAPFDPDVADLRECAAVLGIVVWLRRYDFTTDQAVVYSIDGRKKPAAIA